jgi:hypothetical protein
MGLHVGIIVATFEYRGYAYVLLKSGEAIETR